MLVPTGGCGTRIRQPGGLVDGASCNADPVLHLQPADLGLGFRARGGETEEAGRRGLGKKEKVGDAGGGGVEERVGVSGGGSGDGERRSPVAAAWLGESGERGGRVRGWLVWVVLCCVGPPLPLRFR